MDTRVFEAAFAFTIQHEGKDSNDFDDPGNWTGGRVGVGEFRGTRYGISAAAFPHVDIQSLDLPQVKRLHFIHYWQPSGAWRLADYAPDLACRLYDLAVNCGVDGASRMLQRGINTVCTGPVLPRRRAAWRQAIAQLLGGKALLVDGRVGPITAEVVQTCPHRPAMLMALRGEAYKHYEKCDPANRAGWLNRLAA